MRQSTSSQNWQRQDVNHQLFRRSPETNYPSSHCGSVKNPCISNLGFACSMLGYIFLTISQIAVWCWFTMVESVKIALNKSKKICVSPIVTFQISIFHWTMTMGERGKAAIFLDMGQKPKAVCGEPHGGEMRQRNTLPVRKDDAFWKDLRQRSQSFPPMMGSLAQHDWTKWPH